MASSSPIIHPRLLSSLADFYSSTVTIRENTPTRDATGDPIASWSNLADNIDLACAVASMPAGREVKRDDGTVAINLARIAIAGTYEDILPTMQAVVSSTTYDILAVQHDSRTRTTYLVCEVVT